MSDCPTCGSQLYVSTMEGWWSCRNDDCTVAAVYQPDVDEVEDPRHPQGTLDNV